ncbi:MAG: hypothetical protein AAGD11_09680 [Planctomycetota bacterium]
MPNRLDLPPELSSLIEKREQQDRRGPDDTAGDVSQGEAPTKPARADERRSGGDRRANES